MTHLANFTPCILIVDDNPNNLSVLSELLKKKDYDIRLSINGLLALTALEVIRPDLILLDINMPEFSGYDVCQKIKENPDTAEIPIIFVSAFNQPVDKLKAFSLGAADYVEKPFNGDEVIARIELQLALKQSRAEVQKLNAELEARVSNRTAQLNWSKKKLTQEIIRRKQAEHQLRHLAFHDPLTELPNRNYLLQTLETRLDQFKTTNPNPFALLFLDCDHFKVVNDSLGHDAGDQLLGAIAQRLLACLPEDALLARQGEDEFVILLPQIRNNTAVIQLAQTLEKKLTESFWVEQYELFVSVSMGIVIVEGNYEHAIDILRDADTAMYRAKALGRSQYQIFTSTMRQQVVHRLKLESHLRRALELQEFSLVYQPIVSLPTRKIVGFEALIRWIHPTEGFISPADFIPVAEDTGLILPIGLWTLQEACRQIKAWQQQFFPNLNSSIPGMVDQIPWKVSVNLSVKQFSQPDLIEQIDQILNSTGLNSQFLKLEITETAIMDQADSAMAVLEALKARDIQLAIDDFGTGYSSLSYLHRFPVDTLKIDRSFIMALDSPAKSNSPVKGHQLRNEVRIIQATINLAHDLAMDVVAEGIESEAIAEQLTQLNCDLGQGYLFSKPLTAQDLEKRLAEQHSPASQHQAPHASSTSLPRSMTVA